jgi:hypothetical protein
VRAALDALGRYDELSGQAEYADDQVADPEAGRPPSSAVDLSAQAGAVMRDQLLPDVDELNRTYQRPAADLCARVRGEERQYAVVLGVFGVLALGLLVWWQRDLAVRYRRRLNPPLTVAPLCVLAVMVAGSTRRPSSSPTWAAAMWPSTTGTSPPGSTAWSRPGAPTSRHG